MHYANKTGVLHITKTYKNELKGHIALPASKSISNRVLIINALTGGLLKIKGLSKARDTKILNSLLNKIKSNTLSEPLELNCRDAGTTARFLITYTAFVGNGNYIITGSRRLQQRPMKALIKSLLECGADICCLKKDGFLPLKIKTVQALKDKIFIDCSESSQFLSSLLLIAPSLKNGLNITHKKLRASKPYVDMTIQLMKYFGVEVIKQKEKFIVKAQKYLKAAINIEADWSAAAFWYQIVSLEEKAEIFIEGLSRTSIQGDKALIAIYKELGVGTHFTKEGALIKKLPYSLPSLFRCDFSNTPDIFPSVLLSCAFLNIESVFTGLQNLELKESKRISVLQQELAKFGIKTIYEDDIFFLKKTETNIKKPKFVINTAGDHRIAMSFAVSAVNTGYIYLSEGHSISKSYPDFWKELNSVGLLKKNIKTN